MKYLKIFSNYQKEYQGSLARKPYEYTKKTTLPHCNILFYEGDGSEVFVVVPSIFNSHDILTIGAPHDMISNLRRLGSVYMIEWLEVDDKDFGLEDYAAIVVDVLDFVFRSHYNHPYCHPRAGGDSGSSHPTLDAGSHEILESCQNNHKIHIVGHCLGGNLAVAASLKRPELTKSLILLTTPWDFSHLLPAKMLFESSGLAKVVDSFDHIPGIYIQILFFLLSPDSLEQKLDFYQANQDNIDKSDFFEVERWQFSGHPIPRKAYDQLINEWIGGSIFGDGFKGIEVNPENIKSPAMMVVCKKDKLVPVSSIKVPRDAIKVFEYNTGHIGYLVGSKRQKFIEDLIEWLKTIIEKRI